MKIHLVTNLFHPDELAGASLFTDLAVYLKAKGHDIRVTTTFPYYPAWKLREEDQGVPVRTDHHHGIPVRRVQMYVPEQPTGRGRVLSDLSYFASLLLRGRIPSWIPDVVVTASPMLSQCLVQRFLYLGKSVPKIIVIQDFVVDAALELNILKLPGLPGILRMIENWALKSARTLFTISQPMLEKLTAKLDNSRRCLLVPNWIHKSLEDEIARQNPEPVRRKTNTLFYAGNLGVKQGLPIFIESFKSAPSPWKLVVHGGGAELKNLQSQIADADSVSLAGVLEEVEYVQALRTASACLITQKPDVGANFLPSKLLPALATGTPVLAVCEASSPLGREVIEGRFGEVINPGDSVALNEVLTRWNSQPETLQSMAERSLARAHLYGRETILAKYLQEMEMLTYPI